MNRRLLCLQWRPPEKPKPPKPGHCIVCGERTTNSREEIWTRWSDGEQTSWHSRCGGPNTRVT